MAGTAGIEPANMGTKIPCLTAWRCPCMFAPGRNVAAFRPGTSRLFRAAKGEKGNGACLMALEPVTGIGPAYPAWKAGVLPLNYTDGWCREQIPPTPGGCLSFQAVRRKSFGEVMGYPAWSHQTDSNRRPADYKSAALPAVAMMANKSPEPGGDPGLTLNKYLPQKVSASIGSQMCATESSVRVSF